MPSRLAALMGTKKPTGPPPSILPGVGYIQEAQGAGNKRKLQRSNTLLSTSSSATAVTTSSSNQVPEKVVFRLAAGAELPSVPYKLRFALSSQEWDERLEVIARHRAHSAQPRWEILWFLLIFGIPSTAIYPLYATLLTAVSGADGVSTGQNPTVKAGVITIGVVLLLAMLLATPLFLRKYVVQQRMNKDTNRWAAIDRHKADEPDADVRWRVRLPNIFGTACDIHIPVPPRKRSISLEAAIEKDRIVSLTATDAALSRVGSIASQRSMFDD